jgi:hypothetical protein
MSTETKGKLVTITASRDGYSAQLEVEYGWSSDGKMFYVNTKRYKADDNGRSGGNIKLKLVSNGETAWEELNNDDGVQDGQWHDFVKQKTVQGNARSAIIHFNWIYDLKAYADPNMTGQANVTFP